jgi:demethylmenaquinone methyltransferase/2-methoxy-6-polyprenyl-1,4-benzoquinol methylase
MTHKTSNGSQTRLAPHPTLTEFYPAPAERARFVNDLFDHAAHDYDWMSRTISLGTDRAYRRWVLQHAGMKPGMRVLDVATGTGLAAQAALDSGVSQVDVVGLDASRGMLEENRKHRAALQLIQGFGEALPFRDATFDFIVMGYALRHVEDLAALFAEFDRVLRKPGRALILEISRPSSGLGFALMRFYMQKLLPFLTRSATRSPASALLMKYYWATIAECVAPASILSALSKAGFRPVERKTRGGILNEFLAMKG